jgi:hypothetical protein
MRFIQYSGHFIFLIHFVLAFVFVFERTLYSDSAYFIFNIVNSENFFIGSERYGSIIPQAFPLLAVKSGCSMKMILYVFSVSYILFYYMIYNLVCKVFKNVTAGLAIALSLFLCTGYNYFMIVCELHQAIVFCILLYVLMDYFYTVKSMHVFLFVALCIMLIFLSFFSHPEIIFSLLYLISFVIIDKKKFKDFKLYFLIFIIVLITIGKTILTDKSSYEGNFIYQLIRLGQLVPDFFNLPTTKFFVSHFLRLYLFTFMIGVFLIYLYIQKKEYLKLFLMVSASIVFLFIVNLIFHESDSEMMMERIYLPLSIFVFVPFIKDIHSSFINLPITKIVLIVLVFFSTIRVVSKGLFCRERVEYLSSIIAQEKDNKQAKFIINKNQLNNKLILASWAFSIETLIYSSMENPNNAKTFFISDNPEKLNYDKTNKALFLAVPFWQNRNSSELNEKYFKLPSQPYLFCNLVNSEMLVLYTRRSKISGMD